MKKILFILAFVLSFQMSAQKLGADVIKFSGKVTTTVRNTFSVPANETWLIWNTTAQQFEVGDDTETWGPLMGDGSGAVLSVNGKTGTVIINPDDLDDTSTTNKFITATLLSKLDGIEIGAEMNVQSDWNAATGDAAIINKPTLGALAAKDQAAATDIVGGGLSGQVLKTNGVGEATWGNESDPLFTSWGYDWTDITNKPTIPTLPIAQSDVTGLVADLAGKQATLVSGTNLKTINGESLLGSTDIIIDTGMNWSDPVDSDILPDSPTVRNIGASGNPFSNVYAIELNGITQIRTPNLILTPSVTGNTDEGTIYYDSDTNQFLGRVGATWVDLSATGGGSPTTDASDLTTGVLADARVQASNVTQHESALTITEAQISDLSHVPNDNSVTSAKINDGTILDADVSASAAILGTKINYNPAGGTGYFGGPGALLSSTNVDAAIDELQSEKVDGGSLSGSVLRLTTHGGGTILSSINLDTGGFATDAELAAAAVALTTDQTNELANQSARKHSVVTITSDVDFSASNQYVVSGGTIGGSVLNYIDAAVTVTVPNRGASVDENYFVNLYGADTKEFIPGAGVSFTRTNGAMGDSTAIRFTGGGKLNLIEVADGVFDFDCTGCEPFIGAYSPDNLYVEASAVNADNHSASTYGSFASYSSSSQVTSFSSDNAGNSPQSILMRVPATNANTFVGFDVVLTGLPVSTLLNFRFNYKYPQAGDLRISQTGGSGSESIITTASVPTFTQYTKAFTTSASGTITIKWRPSYNITATLKDFYITDFEVLIP